MKSEDLRKTAKKLAALRGKLRWKRDEATLDRCWREVDAAANQLEEYEEDYEPRVCRGADGRVIGV